LNWSSGSGAALIAVDLNTARRGDTVPLLEQWLVVCERAAASCNLQASHRGQFLVANFKAQI
jgi:hypothetical protein